MSDLNTIIENQLQGLAPAYRDLVTSDFVTEAAQQMATRADIAPTQLEDFETEIFYFLILIEPRDELLQSLQQRYGLDPAAAEQLVLAIESLLPIDFAMAQSKKTDSGLSVEQLPNTPADRNETAEQTQGIRTMADDINHVQNPVEDEPTYTSTQAAILREGEGVASAPPPATAVPQPPPAPTDARWEHTP